MNFLHKNILKITLRRKLILIFGFFLPLVIILLGFVAYSSLYEYTMKLVINIKLKTDISVASEVESLKTRAEDLSNQLLMNSLVQEALIKPTGLTPLDQYFLYRDMQTTLAGMAKNDTVSGIYINANNGLYFRSDDNLAHLARSSPEQYKAYKDAALLGNGRNIWLTARGNDFAIAPDNRSLAPHIYVVRQMKSINNQGTPRGISIVQINSTRYLNALTRNINSEGEYACIIDKQGRVLLHTSDNAPLGEKIDQELLSNIATSTHGYKVLEDANGILLYAGGHGMDWSVVHFIPTDTISSSLAPIGWFMLGAMLVCLFVLVTVMLSFSSSIFNPLQRLAQKLELFGGGEREVRIGTFRQDEIGDLERQFDTMADDVVRSINKVQEQHDTETRLELKVLENQINPHFLYNTLDLINWRMRSAGQTEIAEMTNMLAQFFRISLHGGAEFITLEKEIEHAKLYLQICQIRYGNAFQFQFDVPEDLLCCKMKKLILQPILENAILHGINTNINNGIIIISAWQENDVLMLRIQDNGRGMPKKTLESLSHLLSKPEITDTEAFGLQNINRRIVLAYGEGYGLTIESVPQNGTCITVRIGYIQPE